MAPNRGDCETFNLPTDGAFLALSQLDEFAGDQAVFKTKDLV